MYEPLFFSASLKRVQELDIKNFSPTKTKSFLEDITNSVEVRIFFIHNF